MLKTKPKIAALLAGCALAATSLFAGVATAAANARGCNHDVCIGVMGDANGYTADAQERSCVTCTQGPGYLGHIHIWGPGGLDVTSSDSTNPYVRGSARGSGQLCAEFWRYVSPGNWTSDGLACETVS
jgi:hypothetical protein